MKANIRSHGKYNKSADADAGALEVPELEPEGRQERARRRAVCPPSHVRRVARGIAGRRDRGDDVAVVRGRAEEGRPAGVAVAGSAVVVRGVLAHLEPLLRECVEASDAVAAVALERELRPVLALYDLLARPVTDDGER